MVERQTPGRYAAGSNEERAAQIEQERAKHKLRQEALLQDHLKESYQRRPRYTYLERPLT